MLTLTGNLEAITGSTSGYVKVTLSGYGQDVPRVSGTGVIIQPTITSALASSFSLSLFGNDVITPANTYYVVSFYDMVGNLLSTGSYTFTGIGTINLSSATPVLTVPNASNVLAKVATTGNYNDLINIPVGGGGGGTQVNSDWNATSGVAQVLNKPNLATVATTGNYSDLVGAPTGGGGTQVNSDWTAVTGVAQILNKPTLATVATTGSYLDLTNLPVTGVSSVAGRSGAVTLVEADIANLVTDLAAKEVITNRGVANGYASLDATGKVPAAQLPASSSSAVWGTITGTLANQTDLQTALNAKAPTASPTFTGTVTASSINSAGYQINGSMLDFGHIAGILGFAQLPLPSATTVGGVKSLAAATGWYVTGIGTDGSVTTAQPVWTDIRFTPTLAATKAAVASNYLTSYNSSTGLFTAAQPTWTDIASKPTLAASTTALTSQWLNSYNASTGLFTASQPAFTDISGTLSSSQIPTRTAAIAYEIYGVSGLATPTTLGTVTVPIACTLIEAYLVADTTGSAVVTANRGTFSAFPTVGNIASVTLSSAQKVHTTGLNVALAAGDQIQFGLTSYSGVNILNFTLIVRI